MSEFNLTHKGIQYPEVRITQGKTGAKKNRPINRFNSIFEGVDGRTS